VGNNILTAAKVEMVNIYVSIISTVFATIWSSTWSSESTLSAASSDPKHGIPESINLEPMVFRSSQTTIAFSLPGQTPPEQSKAPDRDIRKVEQLKPEAS